MNLAWNSSLFLWLNQACAVWPDWLWSSLTITGSASVLFALLSLLLLPRVARHDVLSALFVTSIMGGLASHWLKELFQIPRPAAVLGVDQFHLIGHRLDLVSFPSGHTLSVFSVAALLWLGFRLRGWRLGLLLGMSGLVALSRIAVGAHWPLDVLGGALLGMLCGALGWFIAQSLHRRWALGRVYRLVQTLVILGVSLGLFLTNTGYPLALPWQYMAGTIGVCFSLIGLKHAVSRTF